MRAVVQRADGARVVVAGETVSQFEGPGLVVLVGVTHDDTAHRAQRLAAKVHELRIFDARHAPLPVDDDAGPDGPVPDDRRERSASELGLPVIVVSQFTLYGDTRKGRRPTWTAAAPGAIAEPLVAEVVRELRARGAHVGTGIFGADMRVELVNDGPITLVVDVDS
jgi:D-tyrosyl-tRNA(Tyr) deacylase